MQWSTTKIITGLFLLGGLLLGAGAFVLAQNAGDPQQPLVPPQVKPNLGAPQKGKAKPDNERIVGTWKLVDGQGNGEEVPPEFKTFFRMTFTKDDKMTISILDEPAKEGTYKLPAAGQIDSDLGGGLGLASTSSTVTIA